jgi:hypothetical protein
MMSFSLIALLIRSSSSLLFEGMFSHTVSLDDNSFRGEKDIFYNVEVQKWWNTNQRNAVIHIWESVDMTIVDMSLNLVPVDIEINSHNS